MGVGKSTGSVSVSDPVNDLEAEVDTFAGRQRLLVDASISITPGGTSTVGSYSSKLRYEDMNVSTGGVARNASISSTFTKVYEYLGTGFFLGMTIGLEKLNEGWAVRLVIDGEEIFGSAGMDTRDLEKDSLYNHRIHSDHGFQAVNGLAVREDKTFYYEQDTPITYATSVEVYVRKSSGSNKKFRAGFAILTKET